MGSESGRGYDVTLLFTLFKDCLFSQAAIITSCTRYCMKVAPTGIILQSQKNMAKSLNVIVSFALFISMVNLSSCVRVHRLLDCTKSKFGCCPDKVTDAQGWNHKGCSVMLCYDEDKLCKEMKANGDCESLEKWPEMTTLCPKTCGRCGNQGKAASPPACSKSKHGCCYDGFTPAVSEDTRPGVGCPPCKDRYPHTCRQFGHSFWCRGKYPRPRYFLKNYCFRQCGFCKNFKKMVLPKEKEGWRKQFY